MVGGIGGPRENVKRKIRRTSNSVEFLQILFFFPISFLNAAFIMWCAVQHITCKLSGCSCFTFMLLMMDHSFSHIVFGHAST